MKVPGFKAVLLGMLIPVIMSCAGCSPMEFRRVWLGMDYNDATRVYKQYTAVIDKDIDSLYALLPMALDAMGAEISREEAERYFIVGYRFQDFYRSCIDTTEVGIVLKKTEQGATEISTASANSILAQQVLDGIQEYIKEGKLVIKKTADLPISF